MRYAVCMPGCNGDALYSLPTIRVLKEKNPEVEIDFYTSEVCKPIERLMLHQSCISNFIIPKAYKVRDKGQGVQPWKMPVEGTYEGVYQLGFEHFPHGPLHLFLANRAGIKTVDNPWYEFPEREVPTDPYIVVCYSETRGHLNPILWHAYNYLLQNSPIQIIQTGLDIDCNFDRSSAVVLPNLNFLDLLPLLQKAKLFVGFYSAPLVLANGFPSVPRLVTLTSPNCGEQHGLHIPFTQDILVYHKEDLLNEVLKILGA